MKLALPAGVRATVDYYCLRHGGSGSCALRNWELQGSNDGGVWTTLRKHTRDATMTVAARSVGGWGVGPPFDGTPATQPQRSFGQFRILMTGPDSSNMHHLCCSGIELYGTLVYGYGVHQY